jgi:hypothetical protein
MSQLKSRGKKPQDPQYPDLHQLLGSRVASPEDGAAALLISTFGVEARPQKWTDSAACRRAEPDLFTGEDPTGEARALCADCPVRRLCLSDQERWEDAQGRSYERVGVFGGLLGEQREVRALRRRELAELSEGEGAA